MVARYIRAQTLLLGIFVAISIGILVGMLIRSARISATYVKHGEKFNEALTSLYASLENGAISSITVSMEDADSILLLPSFITRDELESAGIIDGSLRQALYRLSQDDQNCPALIWLKN